MNAPSSDIRWKQRFNNYARAHKNLTSAIELERQRELSDLEEQGLIQSFEFTHELAWNVLKDYLEEQGFTDIIGSKNATRIAFKNGLINNGEIWMSMIEARNQTSHTYNHDTAMEIAHKICEQFYPEFALFFKQFTHLYEEQ